MDHELVYIEPSEENVGFYRRLFKKQGTTVCREVFEEDYIVNKFNNSSFGYISISKRASIGRSRLDPSDRFTLNGFILCSILPKEKEDLFIDLICARRESRLGKIMMKHVEIKALEMGFSKLSLFCIAEDGLKEWYESLGFEHIRTEYLGSEIKAYLMKKYL